MIALYKKRLIHFNNEGLVEGGVHDVMDTGVGNKTQGCEFKSWTHLFAFQQCDNLLGKGIDPNIRVGFGVATCLGDGKR